jgi:hypothetical protein
VQIDRSDQANEPGDAHMARRAHSVSDDPNAASKDSGKALTGDGTPYAYPAHPDSALQTESTAAHRAKIDAVYRQYAIDHSHARVEKIEQETAVPAMRRIEPEEPEPHPVGLDEHLKGKARLAAAADLKKGETRQAPGDRGSGYDVVPRTPALVHDCDLPVGYKSAPALKGDTYHPDSVAARSMANQELYAATSRDRAATLGYATRISAQKAPFDSHGQEVFTNGKTYITPDVDGHNVTNGWKMFNRRGARIGTYDSELNYVKE